MNDDFGHECGDMALKAVSDAILDSVREQDCVARWGGEEFTLLLPETKLSGGAVIAEKIRSRVEETSSARCDGSEIMLTVTIGVTEYDDESGIDGSIKRADDALYIGKRDGRNRVSLG